jgi:hypothetical protein
VQDELFGAAQADLVLASQRRGLPSLAGPVVVSVEMHDAVTCQELQDGLCHL